MGAKENLLTDLVRGDTSGSAQQIYDLLVEFGLKYKGPKNRRTIYYYFRKVGKEIGVAAMRTRILSFPAPFWGH